MGHLHATCKHKRDEGQLQQSFIPMAWCRSSTRCGNEKQPCWSDAMAAKVELSS